MPAAFLGASPCLSGSGVALGLVKSFVSTRPGTHPAAASTRPIIIMTHAVTFSALRDNLARQVTSRGSMECGETSLHTIGTATVEADRATFNAMVSALLSDIGDSAPRASRAAMPSSIDRSRPQPTVHGGVTAIDARPVMAVHIDPLEPDGIHNPAVSQPASARDRTPGPSGPPQPVMTDPTSASPSPKGTS